MLKDFFNNIFINLQGLELFLAQTVSMLLTSLIICLFSMKLFLKIINKKNICRQPIRESGPESHLKEKKDTPTMGGLMIILSTIITCALWLDLGNIYILTTLLVFLFFAAIGFIDDLIKVKGSNIKGFRGSFKIILQFLIAGIAILFLQTQDPQYLNGLIQVPFSNYEINIGILYSLFAIVIIVGSANSVNLTDGLDGLVSVPVIISLVCFIIISYIVKTPELALRMQTNIFFQAQNVAFLCAVFIGSILGFLKYNLKPAKIFMGDVGSLSIGALIGIIAVILKIELIFFIIALLFVIEALSVILQVASFKLRRKRVFLMAPIHHHFEKKGLKEQEVVRMFWLAALIFAIIGLLGFII